MGSKSQTLAFYKSQRFSATKIVTQIGGVHTTCSQVEGILLHKSTAIEYCEVYCDAFQMYWGQDLTGLKEMAHCSPPGGGEKISENLQKL